MCVSGISWTNQRACSPSIYGNEVAGSVYHISSLLFLLYSSGFLATYVLHDPDLNIAECLGCGYMIELDLIEVCLRLNKALRLLG